jgi:nitroreductase
MAIIVCGDNNVVWRRPYDKKNILDIDVSIVTDHMMLAATEPGLGSLWVCFFDPDVIKHVDMHRSITKWTGMRNLIL